MLFNLRFCRENLVLLCALAASIFGFSNGLKKALALQDKSIEEKAAEEKPVAEKPSKPSGLFELAEKIKSDSSDAKWQLIANAARIITKQAEAKVGRLPYDNREKLKQVFNFTNLALNDKGRSDSWSGKRHVSPLAPFGNDDRSSSSSYISGSFAVINGHVYQRLPADFRLLRSTERKTYWRGSFRNSLVVVNGSIRMESYIYDSIVIATGPIRTNSYIHNSIVISLADSKSEAGIDVSDGYISNSLVVAKKLKAGSYRNSKMIGEFLKSEGYAGRNDVRDSELFGGPEFVDKIAQQTNPRADIRKTPSFLVVKEPAPTKASEVLAKLLAVEQLTQLQTLADYIGEFTLDDDQVTTLIEAAEATKSDARRIQLWHAIRMLKSKKGRKYLLESLTKADREDLVEFVSSIKNPAFFDVPLLAKIYESSDGKKHALEEDVREVIVSLTEIDWRKRVTEWNSQGMFLERETKNYNIVRQVRERREDEADKGHAAMIGWLIKNGMTDEHRLRIFKASRNRGNWIRYGNDVGIRKAQVEEMMKSLRTPESKAELLLVANFSAKEIEQYLSPKHKEKIRLAAIKSLHEHYIARVGSYAPVNLRNTLRDIAESDSIMSVQTAAQDLLDAIAKKEAK